MTKSERQKLQRIWDAYWAWANEPTGESLAQFQKVMGELQSDLIAAREKLT